LDIYGTAFFQEVSAGGLEIVGSGGSANDGIVWSGGLEIVSAGGSDFGATVFGGGEQDVYGSANTINVSAGLQIVKSGGVTSAVQVTSGAAQLVSSGGFASSTFIFSGGSEVASAGALDIGVIISNGGVQEVFTASGSGEHIGSAGSQFVESGAR
jgi:autotransporter passenger strand-loop-strand repeat protein